MARVLQPVTFPDILNFKTGRNFRPAANIPTYESKHVHLSKPHHRQKQRLSHNDQDRWEVLLVCGHLSITPNELVGHNIYRTIGINIQLPPHYACDYNDLHSLILKLPFKSFIPIPLFFTMRPCLVLHSHCIQEKSSARLSWPPFFLFMVHTYGGT